MGTAAIIVVVGVVAVRFIAPLFILRFPLPAIIVCLVADAVDQTIFQTYVDDPLEWYQSYDKALDVFYLSIAYVSTMRNWRDETAFQIGRFLFFWRLIGVTAFEILGWRFLLLLFPNAFEYYFIAYEAIRTRWNPERIAAFGLVGLAGAITLFIKVPQETWIHLLQWDLSETLAAYPVLIGVVVGVIVGALVALRHVIRRAPLPDWNFTLRPSRHLGDLPAVGTFADRLIDRVLVEKIVFLSLVGVVLAHMVPELTTSSLRIGVTVVVLVVLNAAVTEWWRRRRGSGWSTTWREFIVVFGVNLAILGFLPDALLYNGLPDQDPLSFVVLLSLLSTMFDRCIDTRPEVDEPVRPWSTATAQWRERQARSHQQS